LKKLLTIILLSLYLFNLAGYSFLFSYLTDQTGKQLTSRIEKEEYEESSLVEIKTPLHLPYLAVSGNYERFDGAITINGSHHRYVKRKISADTLYLLCIPNKKSDDLDSAKKEYGRKVNDFDAKDKDSGTAKKSGFATQYNFEVNEYLIASPRELSIPVNPGSVAVLEDCILISHGKPPKVIS